MQDFNFYKVNETLNHKYYQIPQELFINPLYKNALNSDSKLLYGFLLDRLSLSIKNNWHDENGNVYLIFTRKEVQDKLNLSDKIELSHNRKNYDYINGDSTITESEKFRPINTNNNYTYKNNKATKNSMRYSGRDYSAEFLNSLYANV